MSLNNKEILSIAQDSTTFYLYKDYVNSNDLIKIINEMAAKSRPLFVFLPIIKTIAEFNLGILTDEVKYEMLYKVGIASNRYIDLQQIIDMFRMYHIPVSDAVVDKLVETVCTSKEKNVDKDCQIWCIINCLNPKFTKQAIAVILASPLFKMQSLMLDRILKQLVADKDFKSVLEQKELFDYASKNKPELAKQIVKKLLDAKQFDAIAKQSKIYYPWENGILFSDELIEQMIALCLKEHRADLVFDIEQLFYYTTNTKPALAKAAANQLIEDKKEQYISSNPSVLSYIIKHEPELTKKLSFKKVSMETVKQDQTFALLNEKSLPNADLEFAYIKRNNDAGAKFPPKEKLSPETLIYINIITGKSSQFNNLTPRVISALIDCHFNNHADWYKIMEHLLIANPNIDKKFIQQMLNRDKKVEVLIKRHWKGGSKKMCIKKFISEKKQALIYSLGIKQKKH